MTPEEAVRGYTTWNAYAASWEKESGVLAPGRWADITVMDLDPLVVGVTDPGELLLDVLDVRAVDADKHHEETVLAFGSAMRRLVDAVREVVIPGECGDIVAAEYLAGHDVDQLECWGISPQFHHA